MVANFSASLRLVRVYHQSLEETARGDGGFGSTGGFNGK